MEGHLNWTLREVASFLRIGYASARGRVRRLGDGSRGELVLAFGRVPLARVGRTWLARPEDVEQALFGGGDAAPPVAPPQQVAARAARRGRPRQSSASIGIGGEQ